MPAPAPPSSAAAAASGGLVVVDARVGPVSLADVTAASGDPGALVRRSSARCSPEEAGAPLGVVLQLLEPALTGALLEEDDRRWVAGLAADCGASPPLRRLHQVMTSLCAGRPLLLVVHEAEWADTPSLDFLGYALRRRERQPLTVVLTTNLHAPTASLERIHRLLRADDARVHVVEPLGAAEVGDLAAAALGLPEPSPELVAALLVETGGWRGYLVPLLDVLVASRQREETEVAALCASAWPRYLGPVTCSRVGEHSADAVHVLRRLSVLRAPVPPHEARGLAAGSTGSSTPAPAVRDPEGPLGDAELDAALDVLDRLGLLSPAPVAVTPPVVARAVREMLPRRLRAELERRAARTASAAGATDEVVAAHLLLAAPPDEARDALVLERAAVRHLRAGRPLTAAPLLRRALSGGPDPGDRERLVGRLGEAELHVGGTGSALGHLLRTREVASDPEERARVTLRLAHALGIAGRAEEAVRVLSEELAGTVLPATAPLARQMLAETFFVSLGDDQVHAAVRADVLSRMASLEPDAGRDPSFAAVRCLEGVWRCRPAAEVVAGFAPATAEGRRPGDASIGTLVAGAVFVWADEVPAAEVFYRDALAEATAAGATLPAAVARWLLAWAALDAGRLAEADDLTRAAASAVSSPQWGHWQHAHLAVRLRLLRELDRGQEAMGELRRALGRHPLPEAWLAQRIRIERSHLKLDAGDRHGALADARRAQESLGRVGCDNPAVVPWRLPAAAVLRTAGRPEEARALLTEHLGLARRWGAPRTVAEGLRWCVPLVPPAEREGLLAEAEELLSSGRAPLERARVLLVRARLRRDAGDAVGARRAAQEALSVASEHGAVRLVRRAGALAEDGAGPPPPSPGVLTETELEVVELVRAGRSNRQVAAERYMALRTVESHLTSAYRKLGVSGRAGLLHPGADRGRSPGGDET